MSNGEALKMNNEALYFDQTKNKVYEPGEEFHNQVTDNFVELVTKEETGELLEEVLLYYQLKNKC